MMTRLIALFVLLLIMFIAAGGIMLLRGFRSRLSIRIGIIILTVGPLLLLGLFGFNALLAAPAWLRIIETLAVIICGPLLLGLLASLYVTRPLNQFYQAIASLKQNNYRVALQPSGIREFDKVFTELNGLASRLKREEELRKNLISDTSHELHTPLTAILSQLAAMEDDVLPVTKERLRGVTSQAVRLTELVNQLQAYTRARSQVDIEQKESIDLHAFCVRLQETYRTELANAHMHLAIVVPPGYRLEANQQALEQICANLIQNAIRYAHGTVITIKATKHQLRISDNGQGVPLEHMPYLFERFYRVDSSRSRETGGLGIGLSIVRELAERQGWRVRAEDNTPGLAVVFDLPSTRS